MKRLALLLLLAGCGPHERTPDDVLSRERFTEALAGATLIEARMQQELAASPSDTPPLKAYYAELFAELGIDSAAFRASFDHYAGQPLVMKAIYDDVVERLRVMRDESLQGEALAKDTALATDSSRDLNR